MSPTYVPDIVPGRHTKKDMVLFQSLVLTVWQYLASVSGVRAPPPSPPTQHKRRPTLGPDWNEHSCYLEEPKAITAKG